MLTASAPPPLRPVGPNPRPRHPISLGFPSVYHDLASVFSKESALSLPFHRPYDCAINLLPGAPLPVGRLYNLLLSPWLQASFSFSLWPRRTAA